MYLISVSLPVSTRPCLLQLSFLSPSVCSFIVSSHPPVLGLLSLFHVCTLLFFPCNCLSPLSYPFCCTFSLISPCFDLVSCCLFASLSVVDAVLFPIPVAAVMLSLFHYSPSSVLLYLFLYVLLSYLCPCSVSASTRLSTPSRFCLTRRLAARLAASPHMVSRARCVEHGGVGLAPRGVSAPPSRPLLPRCEAGWAPNTPADQP